MVPYSSLVTLYVLFFFLKRRLTTNFCMQNHSCSPNCGIHPCYINEANIDKPLLVMFCDRDIDPYDEICFDYGGGAVGNDDDGEMKERSDAIYVPCRCGASNCKGTDERLVECVVDCMLTSSFFVLVGKMFR